MIDPANILEFVEREPFVPFRIRMTDGLFYDVANPGLVVPMESYLFYAFPKRDRWKLLSYVNISSIDVGESLRRGRRAAR